MSFPNRFTFTNSVGEKMFANKDAESGYWVIKDEDGSERCTATALSCKEHFERKDWTDLKEEVVRNVIKTKVVSTGERWTFTRQEDGTYIAASEDRLYNYPGYSLDDIQRWVDDGTYAFVEEEAPAVQAIDLFMELHQAVYNYGLRYVQHFEDGVMHYTITYNRGEYHAKDEAGVRKIIDLIGQLDQFA